MRALFLMILSTLIFLSCAKSRPSQAPQDITYAKIQQIKRGADLQKVVQILGKPDREECFEEYRILFYGTKAKPSEESFTPLVFKDGYLIERGYFHYNLLLDELRKKNSSNREPPGPETQGKESKGSAQRSFWE